MNIKGIFKNKKSKTAIIIGGTVLKAYFDNKCFEHFNIIDSSFNISPLSNGTLDTYKNSYNTNENAFENMLSKNKSDYIFIDLQKVIADIVNIDGRYFTCNKNTDGEYESEHITDYEPDKYFSNLDRFASIVTKNYRSDKIILVSSFVPSMYVIGKYVRKHKNKFKFNSLYTAFEERFIQKTGCIYYDLSKFYFNEKSNGKPVKFAVFEKDFYKVTKDKFDKLLKNKPLDTSPDYSSFARRYARLCGTLDKSCFNTFLNKNDSVDRFLLSCPDTFCKENTENFKRLKTIQQNKAIKRPLPDKQFVKIYKAFSRAQSGELKEYKDIELVFKNNICIKALLDTIKSNTEIKYKKQITAENYGYFYYKLLGIKNKSFETVKLPYAVDVIGTCISRFIFNFNEKDFAVNNFAFHYVPIMTDVKADYDEGTIDESVWEQKMLKLQCDCRLKEYLSVNPAEWLICDLFTLTATTAFLINNKPVCMMGKGFASKNGYENINISEKFSDEFIIEELKKFADIIMSVYGKNIILVKSKRQVRKLTDTNIITPYTNEAVNSERNRKNDIYTQAFCDYTDCYLVDIADKFYSDERSYVSLSPAHFEEECYIEEGNIIKNIIENKPEQKIFNEYSNKVRLERIYKFINAGNHISETERLFNDKLLDKYVLRLSPVDIKANFDNIVKLYDKNLKTDEELKNDEAVLNNPVLKNILV